VTVFGRVNHLGAKPGTQIIIIILILTDLYSAFRPEDTESLDAAQED